LARPRGRSAIRKGAVVSSRYVALAVAAAFLVPIFLLLSYVTFVSRGTADGSYVLSRQVDGGLLSATLDVEEDRGFTLAVTFSPHSPHEDLSLVQPKVIMIMPDHDMGPTPVSLLRRADGTWQASGTFPMPGRWRFRIGYDDELYPLDVNVL
jgi:hypothetical protein